MSNPTDIIVSHTVLAHLLNKQLQTQTTAQTKKTQTKLNNIKKQKTMNVKPLSDRVLVLPNPAEEKTAGGLIIPDTAKEKPLAGKVVAAGPGTAEVKMEVKEGDQVLYGKYAGTEINVEGTTYLILKQSEILAVIE